MATWNVYSVIKLSVLFEKDAKILTTEPLLSGLESLKQIVTEVFDTVNSFEVGRFVESSGSAEVKFQSSSFDAPLLCGVSDWELGDFGGWADVPKLKIEDGADDGRFCGLEKGADCCGAGDDKMAKGSDEGCGESFGF